jgi:hypothetical protein
MQIFGKTHLGSMETCMMNFTHEYNDVWRSLMTDLENWICKNDDMLEKTTAKA